MSSAGSDANAGTTPIREGYRFDEAALARWMKANVEGFDGPITVEQFKGGQSNPTYKLITPRRSYVLRRKPPGELLKGAHAVEREAQVLSALGSTGFPVAHIYGLCTDDSVIGSWFYVMEMVEGRIFWDARFPDVIREERPAYFDAMNAPIARLHSVDYKAIGLENYGKPGNFFARQIGRWSRQYLEDADAGLADVDLEAFNIPSEEDYVAAYCRRTGRDTIQNWSFYVAFNYFRLAAIFHGIKGRVIRGTAASAHAQERATSFPVLAALAAQAMEKCI